MHNQDVVLLCADLCPPHSCACCKTWLARSKCSQDGCRNRGCLRQPCGAIEESMFLLWVIMFYTQGQRAVKVQRRARRASSAALHGAAAW
jgi:hypothetical protein